MAQKCVSCGTELAEAELVKFGDDWVCAECKQSYVQRIKEGVGSGVVLQDLGDGKVFFHTDLKIMFPECPVTGEPIEKMYSLRHQGRVLYKHPVSKAGVRRLRLEAVRNYLLNAAPLAIIVVYLFVVTMVYTLFGTTILPVWAHVLIGIAMIIGLKMWLAKVLVHSVKIVHAQSTKTLTLTFQGNLTIQYGNAEYVKKLIEANRSS